MKQRSTWPSLAFAMVFSAEFLYQFAIAVVMPIVPNYIVSIGMSIVVGGMVAGLNSIASLVFRPLSGIIIDYAVNKKTLLIVMSVMFMMSAYGCVISSNLAIICICRIIQGIAFAIKSVIIIWMVSAIVCSDSIGFGVGWVSLAYVFASMFGPVVGSRVGQAFGYRMSFFVAGVLFSVALLLAAFLTPQKAGTPQKKDARPVSLKCLLYFPSIPYSVTAGLLTLASGSTATLLLVIAEEREIGGASLFFVIQAIFMLVLRPYFGRISDVKGSKSALYPTLVFSAVSMLVLIWADSLWMIAVSAFCMAAGPSSAYPILQAESIRGVDESMVGRASNTFFIGPDIGMGIGSLLGGAILQYSSSQALFVFNLIIIMLASVIFARAVRRK